MLHPASMPSILGRRANYPINCAINYLPYLQESLQQSNYIVETDIDAILSKLKQIREKLCNEVPKDGNANDIKNTMSNIKVIS